MRGEHCEDLHEWRVFEGSSPHARGTLHRIAIRRPESGIIPACAGNTSGLVSLPIGWWDHPRMRGEHDGIHAQVLRHRGSSPHARGTPHALSSDSARSGIIPACAGNTSRAFIRFCAVRDHPRMRGEHHMILLIIQHPVGSSPHARGTPKPDPPDPAKPGIIPACAGNTRPLESGR